MTRNGMSCSCDLGSDATPINWCAAHARAYRKAVAAEREACAKVAEDDTSFAMQEEFGMQSHYAQLRAIIADAIRARSKKD